MIKVTQLSKVYTLTKKQQKERQSTAKTIAAVQDLSLQCTPGRVFSLLGPNGAGKTTTLRMMATLLTPTSGSIEVCGLSTKDQAQEVRKKIGFLTGSTNLYDRLTPAETVKYFADLNFMEKSAYEERKDFLFTHLGIHEYSKKRVGQLSTGMKQKVSIARSIIHDPEVIIFDEPTSGLDVISAANIIQLIKECKEQGKTVIFSSHIMSEVDLLCDDLAIMANGSLVYSDSMDAFRAANQSISLTEAFINTVNQTSHV